MFGDTGHRAFIILTFLSQPLKLYETEGAKREGEAETLRPFQLRSQGPGDADFQKPWAPQDGGYHMLLAPRKSWALCPSSSSWLSPHPVRYSKGLASSTQAD